jgi:hypothetical protein
MDVIYHLIEDEVYEQYMDNLLDVGAEYLIIYSPDFNNDNFAPHVKARKFTDNKRLQEEYKLMLHHPNDYSTRNYKDGSFADWYVFRKIK